MTWIVELYYQGKCRQTKRYKTREAAMRFYESKLGAMRFGLVGWSVSYPRSEPS